MYVKWPFVRFRHHALIILYMPKFKIELINANTSTTTRGGKFKNEIRILIGYWLAQQLLAVIGHHLK